MQKSSEDRRRAREGPQFGWGEVTSESVSRMLAVFRGVASGSSDVYKCEKQLEVYERLPPHCLAFDSDSVFLDIGSGIGKVVLQVAMEAGCTAGGIEAAKNRFLLSKEFIERLVREKVVAAELKDRVEFVHADAG